MKKILVCFLLICLLVLGGCQKKDEVIPPSNNSHEENDNRINMVNNILDELENVVNQGLIFIGLDGNIENGKVKIEDFKNGRAGYFTKIKSLLDNPLYFANEELGDNYSCKYNIEKILNELGYSSHMGIGLEANNDGWKTYQLK
ncbi:MAG: hypothetical protein WBO70_03460 [Erysipelotrichaceae bacterium]